MQAQHSAHTQGPLALSAAELKVQLQVANEDGVIDEAEIREAMRLADSVYVLAETQDVALVTIHSLSAVPCAPPSRRNRVYIDNVWHLVSDWLRNGKPPEAA